MSFLELAAKRYSLRKFSPQPVEPEKLNTILEAGRLAPTAKNVQPQRLYVVQKPEDIEKIRALTPMAFDAPVIILLGVESGVAFVNAADGRNSAEVDVAIVGTHMMLQAAELGLGTTWVGAFPAPAIHDLFHLPDEVELVGMLPLGYPAEGAHPSRLHAQSKPLEELVTYL